MKKLPIKKPQASPVPEKPTKKGRVPKPSMDELKAMSNEEKIELCGRLGLTIPRYEEGAKDHVIHMHLLHILKVHFGYAENKPRNAGRRPKLTTTVTIHESHEQLKRLEAKIDALTQLVEKLLK